MSYDDTDKVFPLRGLSAAEKAVLLYLAHCRNKDSGLCFPKQETIVATTGHSLASVKRAISKLEARRLIEVGRGKRHGMNSVNHYTLRLPPLAKAAHVELSPIAHGEPKPSPLRAPRRLTVSPATAQSEPRTGKEQGKSQEPMMSESFDSPIGIVASATQDAGGGLDVAHGVEAPLSSSPSAHPPSPPNWSSVPQWVLRGERQPDDERMTSRKATDPLLPAPSSSRTPHLRRKPDSEMTEAERAQDLAEHSAMLTKVFGSVYLDDRRRA